MVLATPPNEQHEFGILAAAMLASMAGIQPVYLGVNLPPYEIAGAAQRTRSQIVVLGITLDSPAVAENVSMIAASLSGSTELWLGGRGSATLDLSKFGGRTKLVTDLPAFEKECQRAAHKR
jgi:hypothetical protein